MRLRSKLGRALELTRPAGTKAPSCDLQLAAFQFPLWEQIWILSGKANAASSALLVCPLLCFEAAILPPSSGTQGVLPLPPLPPPKEDKALRGSVGMPGRRCIDALEVGPVERLPVQDCLCPAAVKRHLQSPSISRRSPLARSPKKPSCGKVLRRRPCSESEVSKIDIFSRSNERVMPKCASDGASVARRRPRLQSFHGWTQRMRPPSPPGKGVSLVRVVSWSSQLHGSRVPGKMQRMGRRRTGFPSLSREIGCRHNPDSR